MILLALGALVVVFFHNALIGGEQFYAGDTYRYFYPLKKVAAEAVQEGRAPVWNPLVHSGMPLHAAMQSGIFYPFSILFYVLPFDFAYKWYVVLHVLLAAAGTYILVRRWRLKPAAAAIAGITYAFSGYVISFIDGLNIFSSIVWLPVIFLLFERAIERPLPARMILAAFAVAAQALAGDPVSGYYTFLICGIYWLMSLFSYSRQRRPRLENFWRMAVLPVVAVLALFLSYVQVGPSQEMAKYSTRAASIGYENAVEHSLEPLRLLTAVVPYVFGNSLEDVYDLGAVFASHFPLERTLYVGIMPLLLIPVAFLAFRERRVYFFTGILVFGLLLSLGKYTPLYNLAHSLLPMFGKFRYPMKAFFLVSFAAAVLTGYGMNYLVSQETAGTQRLRPAAGASMKYYSTTAIGISLFLLIVSFSDYFLFDLTGGIFLKATSATPSITSKFIPYMKGEILRASFLLFLASALVLLRYTKRIPPYLFRLFAISFICMDLLTATYRAMDTTPESFYTAPRVDSVLFADKSLFRLYRTPLNVEQFIGDIGFKNPADYYLWNREMLAPNIGSLFGYAYTDGYESANLLWHNMFIKFIEASPPLLRPRLLGLLNVKYIFASHPVNHPDLQLKMSLDNNIFLYENLRCLPRAYFAPVSIVAANEQIALRVLASDGFNQRQAVVLVDKGGPGSLNPQPGIDAFAVDIPPEMRFNAMNIEDFSAPQTRGLEIATMMAPVQVLEYSPNRIRVRLIAPSNGHLVLCDAYYPLWKASINGRRTTILRANCTVRAIEVPAGESVVEFTYDTRSFKISVMISLVAVFCCVGVAAIDVLKRRRQE